jgi:hypothetical protein
VIKGDETLVAFHLFFLEISNRLLSVALVRTCCEDMPCPDFHVFLVVAELRREKEFPVSSCKIPAAVPVDPYRVYCAASLRVDSGKHAMR